MLDMATETEDPTPSKAKNCVKLKYVHFFWTFKVLMPIVTSDEIM